MDSSIWKGRVSFRQALKFWISRNVLAWLEMILMKDLMEAACCSLETPDGGVLGVLHSGNHVKVGFWHQHPQRGNIPFPLWYLSASRGCKGIEANRISQPHRQGISMQAMWMRGSTPMTASLLTQQSASEDGPDMWITYRPSRAFLLSRQYSSILSSSSRARSQVSRQGHLHFLRQSTLDQHSFYEKGVETSDYHF